MARRLLAAGATVRAFDVAERALATAGRPRAAVHARAGATIAADGARVGVAMSGEDRTR